MAGLTENDVRIGTMGWSYEDWRGSFYEANLPASKMLEQYARTFSTVELDTTFYGVPRPTTLTGWKNAAPPRFLFSAKAPRAVTHERRLVGASESARDFGDLLQEQLGKTLGALLIQLPPDFTADERPALETFVQGIALPSARKQTNPLPWVVEFRHGSWAQTDVGAFLEAHNVSVATTERLDLGGPLRYLRLLGTENSVARFDAKQFDKSDAIASWAERIQSARQTAAPDTPPLLVYVRNFFEGHAPATIAALRAKLGLPEITPPGQQQMALF